MTTICKCCNSTSFNFISWIPSIIKAYNNKTPVNIFIPITNATLTISFEDTPNNYKGITNGTLAANYARKICLLYLSKIRIVTIPQLNCQIPCTSLKSIKLISEYMNSENLSVYSSNLNSTTD